ncbi:RNA-binding protein 48 [Phytophthora cinnamomi]|uniref:RNA-binding protein 48 n=1 Tax=Phytophthora cinnamomi TaxID=4785 RepID=UPI00355A83F4|nr:RNA-binding protein 48 [Phytophthora cinnamomi]
MADRSVRVFTVANESRYVVVRNVPALGVIADLLKRLSLYGKVCEYRLLDHEDDRQAALLYEHAAADEDNDFTDTVWVQYETVNNARHAKARGVQKPFYGSRLQISYAPQFESREDTDDKLAKRRQLLQCRARPAIPHGDRRPAATANKRPAPWNSPMPPPLPPAEGKGPSNFIGPQLPPRPQQAAPKPLSQAPQPPQPRQPPLPTAATPQNIKRRRI